MEKSLVDLKLSNTALVPNKQTINIAANNLIACVEDGDMSALLAYGQLSALEELVKVAKSRISQYALYEAEKYNEKSFDAFGMNIQVKEVGVKYDYSDNARWCELKEQCKLADSELKGHETTLKKMGAFHKTSTTSVAITLKK